MNVWTVSKGDGEVLDIIFVDTNNVISGTSKTVPKLASSVTSANILAMDNGLYIPMGVTFITDPTAHDHTPANLLIFKFASVADTQGVTLKITDADDTNIYTEAHASGITDGPHYFTVDGSGYMNNGGTSGSLSGDHGTGLDAGTTYYYTVTGTVDGVLLTGSFVYSGN